ncbi:M23 family metallopeptidase [Streptomyces sp. NPDC051636]|uniref:M23 family metallopeptidase n=1 Tax=Streptomyces sp. NPDC051636 TaxID=3365663 RepID=UPI0037B177C1
MTESSGTRTSIMCGCEHPCRRLAFGSRKHPLTGVTRLRTGVDFGAPRGAQVLAARQGRVVFDALTKAYGNRIVTGHGTLSGKRLQTYGGYSTDPMPWLASGG